MHWTELQIEGVPRVIECAWSNWRGRVEGARPKAPGRRHWIEGKLKAPDWGTGSKVPGQRCRVKGAGSKVLDQRCRIKGKL